MLMISMISRSPETSIEEVDSEWSHPYGHIAYFPANDVLHESIRDQAENGADVARGVLNGLQRTSIRIEMEGSVKTDGSLRADPDGPGEHVHFAESELLVVNCELQVRSVLPRWIECHESHQRGEMLPCIRTRQDSVGHPEGATPLEARERFREIEIGFDRSIDLAGVSVGGTISDALEVLNFHVLNPEGSEGGNRLGKILNTLKGLDGEKTAIDVRFEFLDGGR